ncbi:MULTISPECIES: hypothetical protein [unclassified Rhodococcus (in: high G+C Gram-positive bacteria)]|uniref:hypothetical protein n=1 Tax=unclassified Rhodococcus (in: high G+C Gram-positive bacteria) TaxID=192944 RepID=UPI001F11C05D|nr:MULTISPECIES: hypothetical protein [unclassified Rhodococcus (in: high G+C Gram-positive bacteria)]
MSRFSMRKTLTGVAIAALATSGLLISTGAAHADTAHPKTSTVTSNQVTITKSVVGDGEVAPGGKLTVRTTVSANGHPDFFVNKFVDRFPAGYTYIKDSASIDSWHFLGLTQKTEKVSPTVDNAARTVTIPDAGWNVSITGSKTVTFEVSYLVPDNAQPGTYVELPSSIGISLWGTDQNISGVYAKIRAKNPGEAAASGSADLGFGSSDGEGGTGSAGSSILDNPAGFISDIISGVLANGS